VAVEEFQRAQGLAPSGEYLAPDREALAIALAGRSPQASHAS
jgi:hypothetical protein